MQTLQTKKTTSDDNKTDKNKAHTQHNNNIRTKNRLKLNTQRTTQNETTNTTQQTHT